MEPLQLIAYESSAGASRRLTDSLPDAPRVPPATDAVPVRARLADLLRRTADRVDPWPADPGGRTPRDSGRPLTAGDGPAGRAETLP